jgi:thioredoxin reductase
MGTEYKTISEIVSQTQDPKTGIWTIKTKGLGKKGEGGETLQARILTYGTGTRPRDAPFELRDANGNPIEETDLSIPGQTVHIDDARGMRREAGQGGDMGAIGAANSSIQGAEIIAGVPNSGVFHIVVRGDDLAKVSDMYLPALKHLVDTGKVKIHLNSTVDHVEAQSTKNGNQYVIVTKETPKERLQRGEPLRVR